MEERKLLKPGEVCRRLSISNETMHALIAEGKLEALKLGPKSTRVYADSLEKLIENGAGND